MFGSFRAAAASRRAQPTLTQAPELGALRLGLELMRGFDAAVVALVDAAGRILFVNDVAAVVYGRRRDELLGMRLAELRHAQAPAEPSGEANGAPVASVHERADGTPFPVEVGKLSLQLDGQPFVLAIIRDVTEERLTTEAMSEGAAQHRTIFSSLPMVQFTIDADGRFEMLEGRGLEGVGLRPGSLVGVSVYEAAKEIPAAIAAFLRAVSGEPFSSVLRIGRRSFEIHWVPVRRENGTIRGVSGVALDVTARVAAERARKESEAQLMAADRLASMGRLAAGVAHEINNPLAWVMSNLELAAERIGVADPELAELVADARVGAERVRDIARDLRVFARSEQEGGSGCDAAAVARVSLSMARNELRHRARVETHFEPVARVAIPERQLGQVLVNLLVNAAQAIGEGAAAENRIGVTIRPEGEGVLIEVADSGCGMRPEIRDRIFEPYFTTKRGDGMGLGLALCQTMVTEAGGRIAVESAPGKGTTFRIHLPTLAAVSAGSGETPAPTSASRLTPARPRPAVSLAAPRRTRLLVVDDEPLIGKTVARALAEHEVEYVGDAREALDRILGGANYDAVICDLMMPEMTGMDLAQRLLDAEHELADRMVFLTGGAFSDRARAFIELTHAPVVQKPFERKTLKDGVAAVLRVE
jgi:PAS domain S-box-containing protein